MRCLLGSLNAQASCLIRLCNDARAPIVTGFTSELRHYQRHREAQLSRSNFGSPDINQLQPSARRNPLIKFSLFPLNGSMVGSVIFFVLVFRKGLTTSFSSTRILNSQ
ncbi:hypothetical protein N7G274_010509 [Stereocaulon virgatum]|uniref:Uncharacterized protein n=1 Tax=Stereocaulon virgatum TaxID=373712 RepID=A0ABR3ZTH0_9LECA